MTRRVLIGAGLLLAIPAVGLASIQTAMDVLVPEGVPRVRTSPIPPPQKSRSQLQRGFQVYKQTKDIEKSLALLTAAAEAEQGLPPAQLMMARLLLSESRVAEARILLERAAAAKPDYPGIYITFGQLALAEGGTTVALVCFDKAVALTEDADRNSLRTRFFLTQCLAGQATVAERRGRWSEAEAILEDWLKLEPDSGTVRHRLARAMFRAGRHDEAFEQFELAFEEEPRLDPAPVSMAWLCQQEGDLKSAAAWMEKAVRATPDDVRCHLNYGRWLLENDRANEAKLRAEGALAVDRGSRDAQLLLGQCGRALGRFEEAERWFRAVRDASADDAVSANLLALALVEQEDETKRNEALRLALDNVRKHPQVPQAHATLGWIHHRLGKTNEAETALRRASARHNLNSETAYYLAHVLVDRGKRQDAVALLESAVEAPGVFVYRLKAKVWLQRLKNQPHGKGSS